MVLPMTLQNPALALEDKGSGTYPRCGGGGGRGGGKGAEGGLGEAAEGGGGRRLYGT